MSTEVNGGARRDFTVRRAVAPLEPADIQLILDDFRSASQGHPIDDITGWLAYELADWTDRPLATGLTQGEDGTLWVRTGIGLWGTQHWHRIEPVTTLEEEIELPVRVEVMWATRDRVIGLRQVPGQPGRLYFLSSEQDSR